MPTGSPRRPARGFTYLGLLLILAVSGAALAALGSSWRVAAQRERERELLFRGEQIRAAVARFRQAQEPRQWPSTLEELVADGRSNPPRHHLRRLFTDPFTGRADWVLLPAPAATPGTARPPGFAGVRSRADVPRLDLSGGGGGGGRGAGPTAGDGATHAPRVSDWTFVHADNPAPDPRARPARTAPR